MSKAWVFRFVEGKQIFVVIRPMGRRLSYKRYRYVKLSMNNLLVRLCLVQILCIVSLIISETGRSLHRHVIQWILSSHSCLHLGHLGSEYLNGSW